MYDELYGAWKREKESVEVQALPRDFYAKLAEYMKRIREESRMLDEKTTKARLMRRELENVEKMVSELVQLRYDKALRKTITEKIVPRETLTAEEEKLHREILPSTESFQSFLKDILRGRLSRAERKEKTKYMLVRFLQAIPAVIGSDMKTYGPYKAEDIANLPRENARILIKQGVAEEISIQA